MSHDYWKESKLHPLRATGHILVRYIECTETDVHNPPGSTLFYILALNFLYLNLMFFPNLAFRVRVPAQSEKNGS